MEKRSIDGSAPVPDSLPVFVCAYSSEHGNILQSVEGENPVDNRAKVPLEVTRGGLAPSWGGVRRGRQAKIAADRQITGLQHILLRLSQARERGRNTETGRERDGDKYTDNQSESAFPLISGVCRS